MPRSRYQPASFWNARPGIATRVPCISCVSTTEYAYANMRGSSYVNATFGFGFLSTRKLIITVFQSCPDGSCRSE